MEDAAEMLAKRETFRRRPDARETEKGGEERKRKREDDKDYLPARVTGYSTTFRSYIQIHGLIFRVSYQAARSVYDIQIA